MSPHESDSGPTERSIRNRLVCGEEVSMEEEKASEVEPFIDTWGIVQLYAVAKKKNRGSKS